MRTQSVEVQTLERFNSYPAETREQVLLYYNHQHPFQEPLWKAVVAWEKRNEADIARAENQSDFVVTSDRPGDRNCDHCGGCTWIQEVTADKGIVVHRCGCFPTTRMELEATHDG